MLMQDPIVLRQPHLVAMHSALQEQVTSLAQFFGMRSNLIIFGFNFPLSITQP